MVASLAIRNDSKYLPTLATSSLKIDCRLIVSSSAPKIAERQIKLIFLFYFCLFFVVVV